jgi:hypothetical protein
MTRRWNGADFCIGLGGRLELSKCTMLGSERGVFSVELSTPSSWVKVTNSTVRGWVWTDAHEKGPEWGGGGGGGRDGGGDVRRHGGVIWAETVFDGECVPRPRTWRPWLRRCVFVASSCAREVPVVNQAQNLWIIHPLRGCVQNLPWCPFR